MGDAPQRINVTRGTPDNASMSQAAIANSTAERERVLLASYAMHGIDSAGRRHPEAAHAYRGPYQRDRDRIVHSSAFRRLSQKTQVFTGEMGDYHRTRLTHTLEVSSIARTISRALRLNEDFVEALALAHDLGHPPFGHSGEEVLNECLKNEGGFNHNAQALRICEILESGYPGFPGLNLTFEVLEGQQHRATKAASASREIGETKNPLLEVRVVDAADSIAYDAHDADDSLELGLLTLDQLLELELWRDATERIPDYSRLNPRQLRRAIVHQVLDWLVSDLIEHSLKQLSRFRIATVNDARHVPLIVQPSAEIAEKKRHLELFLFDNVYRHPGVLLKRKQAQEALRETFSALMNEPKKLPSKFQRLAESQGIPRAVADYLAGMTDRFAFEEHERLVND
jgi:dGTPase